MAGTYDEGIAQFNAHIVWIPATTGYSLNQWRHGLNMMLEKASGNIDVEWL